jgi:hypothetical protein
MKYDEKKREIIIDKQLNNLDKFVLDFVSLIGNYVIVSGYVSILFGRSRATEDVDLLIPKLTYTEFQKLWDKIDNNFECINILDSEKAFKMLEEHAIRFAKKGRFIPNIEFKIIKTDLDRYSFENRIKVILGKNILFISPLEMQIAFKLFLAAEGTDEELKIDKDVEDARYIYRLFKGKINKEELLKITDKLNIRDKLKWL